MNRIRVAGYQRMPPRQFFAFYKESVGTGMGQLFNSSYLSRGKQLAVRFGFKSGLVDPAATGGCVQIAACRCKQFDFSGRSIFNAMQAAKPALITERFPFSLCHFLQGFYFPELNITRHV
jgi:hypothetical protein